MKLKLGISGEIMTINERRRLKLSKSKQDLFLYGCAEIEFNDRSFRVSYPGNMGSSMFDVNSDLEALTGLKDSIDFWKKHALVKSYKEKGSPDYLYSITFTLKKGMAEK